jgi:hypothetical protein
MALFLLFLYFLSSAVACKSFFEHWGHMQLVIVVKRAGLKEIKKNSRL